jgi:hypothetical protein
MYEITGDIWSFASQGYIVIPTNGIVKANGEAVMGAGMAKEAASRFPGLPAELGGRIKKTGNRNYYFTKYGVMTFPTKHDWKDPSDIQLITQSAAQLGKDLEVLRTQGRDIRYFLPKVGCGLGGLKWEDVRAAILPHLDDNMVTFVI